MKKTNPMFAGGLALLALFAVIFAVRFSASSNGNGTDLTPKPKADSPTFAVDPAEVAAAKMKSRKITN